MRGQALTAWEIRSAVLSGRAETLQEVARDRTLALTAADRAHLETVAEKLRCEARAVVRGAARHGTPESPVDHRCPEIGRHTLHGAFVSGAKWWEFTSTGGTMWASDRDKAWAEAERRYGALPEQTADTYRIDSVTTHERTGHNILDGGRPLRPHWHGQAGVIGLGLVLGLALLSIGAFCYSSFRFGWTKSPTSFGSSHSVRPITGVSAPIALSADWSELAWGGAGRVSWTRILRPFGFGGNRSSVATAWVTGHPDCSITVNNCTAYSEASLLRDGSYTVTRPLFGDARKRVFSASRSSANTVRQVISLLSSSSSSAVFSARAAALASACLVARCWKCQAAMPRTAAITPPVSDLLIAAHATVQTADVPRTNDVLDRNIERKFRVIGILFAAALATYVLWAKNRNRR